MGSFKPQVVVSGSGTVVGGTVSIPLNPVAIGELMAVRILQSISGTYGVTITDQYGYDILRGLGATAGGVDTAIDANQVGGNPCQGLLTMNITSATNGHVFTAYTYIKSNAQLRSIG